MNYIQATDLEQIRSLSDLRLSPDGKHACFRLTKPNLQSNCYTTDLWIYNLQEKFFSPLAKSVGAACFLNANTLLFPATINAEYAKRIKAGEYLTAFYSCSIADCDVRQLFTVPLKNASVQMVTDNLVLLSSVRDNSRPDIEALEPEERASALALYSEESDYEVCDEVPFLADGRGFINKKRRALHLYDLNTGVLTPITDPLFETSQFAISPTGKFIAFAGVHYDRFFVRSHGIYLYDIQRSETQTLLEPGTHQIMGLDFMGDHLMVAAAPWDGFGPFPNHDLYTIELRTHSMKCVHHHDSEDFGCKSVSDSRLYSGTTFKVAGNSLYYITSWNQTTSLNVYTPNQPVRCITDGVCGVDFFAVDSETILTVGFCGKLLQELYQISANSGDYTQLSRFNETFSLNTRFSTPQLVSVVNHDQVAIEGYVIPPANYSPGKKYPAVFEIHGGPRANYTPWFSFEMQLLSALGYFVFYCNPRGSAGRGEVFAQINGVRGTIDFADMMDFTDQVLHQYPDIDRARLGVMGGSYGGYSTNWIIGHTDRFRAAVSMRSIANVIGDFGSTDFGIWGSVGAYGATPWTNRERLWEQSPLSAAMNVTTPTLFLHSFEDYRCSLNGAMQMYSALQITGVDTRMRLFKGECHELSRSGAPKHRLRRLTEITQWLEKYLTPED